MKFTFKPFKAEEKGTKTKDQSLTPEQRRREQVRRAQKNHRERKEAYTRSLEAEVVQLRANEARIRHETKTLYTEINILKGLLVQHGIPIPPSPSTALLSSSSSTGTGTAALTSTSSELTEPMFDLRIREAKTRNRQERIYSKRSAHGTSRGGASTSSEDWTSLPPNSPTHMGGADQTAVGIDFVLTLEAPCLGHHAVKPADVDDPPPNGHAMMLTATVLHEHPADLATRLQPGPTWQVPAAGIERLLELADAIPLDGEVTPVQAWSQIRQHPQFHTLELERLEALKTKLLGHVKCYGFGGVIEQGAFENAVFDAFVVGKVF